MRAYVYQARSLIGSDSSGLSDPFARVIIGDCIVSTQVIDETLSPTWDEMLLFRDVLLYSSIEWIKANTPTIVIEIFDRDKVGKAEFIGRTLARPHIKTFEDIYATDKLPQPPPLEWYEITRGGERAGELLATFELLEIPRQDPSALPELPPVKERNLLPDELNKGPVYPVPVGIRPTLSKYRVEVLFWGLRDLKRVHLLSVDKPRVDIECSGHIIYSSVIQNARRNPNFANPVKFVDVELPDQDLYRPPLTIRVVDCRSFGRITLVGTHTINSIHKYIYTPKSKRERDIEDRKKSMIQLDNVDLRANCIIQDDVYTIENEKESCPLLIREGRCTMTYGTRRPGIAKQMIKNDMRRKISTDSSTDHDEKSKDWWTKYFASIEAMIEDEKQNKRNRQSSIQSGYPQPSTSSGVTIEEIPRDEVHSPRYERDRNKRRPTPSPKPIISPVTSKKNQIPKSSLTKVRLCCILNALLIIIKKTRLFSIKIKTKSYL